MAQWDRDRLLELVPEAEAVTWEPDHTALDWIQWAGTAGQAIAYSQLFWPDFVEHDGCLFLADGFDPDNYQHCMESSNGDRTRVESVINHRHILDIFDQSPPSRAQIMHLGKVLQSMWGTKLRAEFPGRAVVVWFPEDEDLSDDLDYQITFFQDRS
ncbi:hypothetical protein TA3x_003632 [Tundrisphaera sp. TA3]|uniref:hypothetical protein n=1 Tax=Tundrisphaera sp. TA3 TaxID=3435775 RepID=UPI003EBF5410